MVYSFGYTRQRNSPGARSHARDRQPHTRQRNREPAQTARKYRLTRPNSTAGASYATDNVIRGEEIRPDSRSLTRHNLPQTPHAEAHTPAGLPSPTQTRPRTQKTAGTRPFGPAPTVRASRAPAQSQHKASEKLTETSASPQISRSALRRASRPRSRSR